MSISITSKTKERMQGIIMIPARAESTRLPQKLLLEQSGSPLLSYAVERAMTAVRLFPHLFQDVYVAADDERLCQIAEKCGARTVKTRLTHRNGTSRIAEAVRMLNRESEVDFIVNLQGDHPQITPQAIVQVVMALLDNPSCDISTAAVQIDSADDKCLASHDEVKVSFDHAARATGFSRAPVVQNVEHNLESQVHYRHVGLYAYRPMFLETYANLPPSPGELREDLEQLRALEHQADIRVVSIPAELVGNGIDTAEQYATFVQSVISRRVNTNAGVGNR